MELAQPSFVTVTTTTPNKKVAKKIARKLVKERLVACAQIFPIESIYSWKDQIEEEKEWLIQCKTEIRNLEDIENLVHKLHPYEVPELIATPIAWTSSSYGEWIDKCTQPVIS